MSLLKYFSIYSTDFPKASSIRTMKSAYNKTTVNFLNIYWPINTQQIKNGPLQ